MTINESEYTVKRNNGPETLVGPPEPEQVDGAIGDDLQKKFKDGIQLEAQTTQDRCDDAKGLTRSSAVTSVIRSINRSTSLAEIVRFCGAGMIAFALSLFLLQGVDATNDLQRFHLLLAQTGLLGVAGFATGYLLKEPRGARVFFSLGLLSIPANMAVLGAMIFSVVHAGELSAHYPEYANWQASNLAEICTAIATGTVVLVPMALFAFSVFARQSRTWLTFGYLVASAMLLIPARNTFLVAVLAGLLVMGLWLLIRRQRALRDTVLTAEARFSQLLLFLPPVLMVVRSAMLYSSELSMLVMLSSIAYLLLRFCSKQCQAASWLVNSIHLFTALAATCLAAMLSTVLAISNIYTSANLAFCLILGVLLLDLSRLVPSSSIRWWMHAGWALLCVPAFFGNYVFLGGVGSIVVTLLICVLMTVSGVICGRRLVTALGILALLGNVLLQGSYMTHLLFTSNWMTLAMAGAAIVITGSVIERYGVSGKLRIQAWLKLQEASRMVQPSILQNDNGGGGVELDDDSHQDMAA